jgi:hypothetical protein
MFGHQFYPTTDDIAQKVYRQFNVKSGDRILDPSAGDGALLKPFIRHSYEGSRYGRGYSFYAIELDPELRVILDSGKITIKECSWEKDHPLNIRVIGSDFMDFCEPGLEFDAIAMNPPFDAGAKHVLKAWELLAPKGRLVALLNAETLRNPYSSERQQLQALVDGYGMAEELGRCFSDSRNPTEVEVVMITLDKPKREKVIDFGTMPFEVDAVDPKEFAANPLAHTSSIKNLVAQYKAAEAVLVQRHELQSKLDFYLKGINSVSISAEAHGKGDRLKLDGNLAEQVAVLKARFWNTVFTKTSMGEKTTTGFRKEFDAFVKSQSIMAFTEGNILEVLHTFFGNREQIMERCLLEVFDKATAYHEKNKVAEGWKTNKSWKINNVIIHPYAVEHDQWGGWKVGYRQYDFFQDLDNVLGWLSGVDISAPEFKGTLDAIREHCSACSSGYKKQTIRDYTGWQDSEFFEFKMFKKGTVHLKFKDQYMLNDFNQMAAKGKKWLGAGY